jgi:cytochrome b561
MKLSILVKQVLPFFFLYSMMIIITIIIDYLLHYFELVFIGRYLGLIGTCLIVLSFVYSLRKRKIIQSGSPKELLKMHEYLAWIGSVLILVHAGVHFNSILPWLAVLMLLINVASGLVGKFLIKSASTSLSSERQELLNAGISLAEAEKKLFFDIITVKAMKKWRVVHLPIAYTLGILSLLHIVTVLIFSG